jgi:phosphoribosylanthranilate isomerase
MWVKICGISDLPTARRIAELRPDAIGLNFHTPSPRAVAPRKAAAIAQAVRGSVDPVGLFVNHGIDQILATCSDCDFATLQLHGDETADFIADLRRALPNARIIRVHRLGSEGIGSLADSITECAHRAVKLDACLVDARVEGTFGGTGQTAPWDVLARDYRRDEWPPLILAGGLNPENVADAIRTVRPWGVDVASGVESSPGQKDLAAVERFIRAARMAFAATALS